MKTDQESFWEAVHMAVMATVICFTLVVISKCSTEENQVRLEIKKLEMQKAGNAASTETK